MTSRRVLTDDLKTVEFETSEDVDVTPTFDSMGLREELLRGIYAYGKIWNKVGGEVFTWIEIGLKHCIYIPDIGCSCSAPDCIWVDTWFGCQKCYGTNEPRISSLDSL